MKVKRIFIAGLLATALAVAIPAVAIAGYSPSDRPTFQCITPTNCPGANYVVFNSFTNAPNYGDERAFFDVRDASLTGTEGGFHDQMTIHDGQRLQMRVYVHNDANPNAIGVDAATAHNTQLKVLLPTSIKTLNNAAAQISADNANPKYVSDTITLSGANPFSVTFDTGSAVQMTYRPGGTGNFVTRQLMTAKFANNHELDANMGDWHGCFNFSALISFTAVVHMQAPPAPQKAPVFIKKIAEDAAGHELSAVPTNTFSFKVTCDGDSRTVTYNTTPQAAGECTVGSNVTITENAVNGWKILSTNPQTFKVPSGGVTAVFKNQEVVTTPPTKPTKPVVKSAVTTLPNTGPGEVAGLFAGTSTLGAALHFASRRFRR